MQPVCPSPSRERAPYRGGSAAASLHVRRLGRMGYPDACALQSAAATAVAAGGRDQLLVLEHPAMVTVGRGGAAWQLRVTAAELRRRGVALYETDRGGGATYHGPGQLVGYPIVDLRRRGTTPRVFLRRLEAALVATLLAEGIEAFVRPGLTGVWTTQGKIAALGIAVRRGITRHGFALNVAPRLEHFDLIVPCGLAEPVTSLAALGWGGERAALTESLARRIAAELGR